jgi:putative Ca2+/H+ antiporter (TMEM165/GDT1 family)
VPLQYIQIAAAISFVFFGLWTIRGDQLEGEDKRFSFDPFWTVAVAFFIAEMGDKTQLATVALAAISFSQSLVSELVISAAFLLFSLLPLFGMIFSNQHIDRRNNK